MRIAYERSHQLVGRTEVYFERPKASRGTGPYDPPADTTEYAMCIWFCIYYIIPSPGRF